MIRNGGIRLLDIDWSGKKGTITFPSKANPRAFRPFAVDMLKQMLWFLITSTIFVYWIFVLHSGAIEQLQSHSVMRAKISFPPLSHLKHEAT
jgi:hypothetical protein